jgi:hypothetical protein
MAGYARPRQDTNPPLTWADLEIRDIEGNEMTVTYYDNKVEPWMPESEWVHSYFFCSDTGLYVLSEDEDSAFTAPSIDLEFAEEIPDDND